MSSLESNNQPISKSRIKHGFGEFQGVMQCEESFKTEIANLKRDRHAKNVVGLLDRNGVPVVLERIQYEGELGKSQSKCYELEEVVTRLNEEKWLLTDRVKLAEERCDWIFTQNMIITNEKNSLISELNEKIKELENKNLESERLAGVYRENYNNSIFELNEKIKELENKILESERLVGVYREKGTSLDCKIAEDSRQSKSEELKLANKTIEELRLEKVGLNKKPELFESRLENSSARINPILAMKVGGIANLPNDLCMFGTSEVGLNLDSTGLTVKNLNSSENVDDEVVNRLSKKGVHTCGKLILSCSCKSTCSSPPLVAVGAIIEISDSDDDETNPDGLTHISNRVFLDTKLVKTKANLVPARLSSQTSKRNITDCAEGELTSKRKRDVDNNVSTHEKENQILKPARFGTDSSLEKINYATSDEDSEDKPLSDSEDSEDEPSSDSEMMELVKILGRKFPCEADMLKAFQQDEEFCMSAVCALYRQQLLAKESKGLLNSSKYVGFSPNDSFRICALGKYLIDGDTELKLRKSVSEVKLQRPEVINQCRKLASSYVENLFAIHGSAVDSFFC